MPLAAHEFDRVVNKFGYQTRSGSHLFAWLEVDGKVVARTRRSWKDSGDLPMEYSIRQQLKLNESQLSEAVSCTLSRDDYLDLLREKGLIPSSEDSPTT